MTVQAGTGKHSILPRCCCSLKGFEVGVNVARVLGGIMTALAEKRRLPVQKLRMIAAMGHMACKAILLHGRVLP